MAQATLTLVDLPNNKVKFITDPPIPVLLAKGKAKEMTSAEAYIVFALNQIRTESKRQRGSIIIPPGTGKDL